MTIGKSVDEIMIDEMHKACGSERKNNRALADILHRALEHLPSHMVKAACLHHGYTLLDNGYSWSKHNNDHP